MTSLLCGTQFLKRYKQTYLQNRNRRTDIENQLTVTKKERGQWGRGIYQKLGMNLHTLQYIRQIPNKDLLYGTGNSTQYSVMTCMRKEFKKSEYVYMCG